VDKVAIFIFLIMYVNQVFKANILQCNIVHSFLYYIKILFMEYLYFILYASI
jgi:hypothetical protein